MKDSHEHPHRHEHEHVHVHGSGEHSHPHQHEHLHPHGHHPVNDDGGESIAEEASMKNGHFHEHEDHAGAPHFHGHESSLLNRFRRWLSGRF